MTQIQNTYKNHRTLAQQEVINKDSREQLFDKYADEAQKKNEQEQDLKQQLRTEIQRSVRQMNQEMDVNYKSKIYSDLVSNRQLEQKYLREAIRQSDKRFE